MSRLNLPPDVQQQMQRHAQAVSQLYSTAFTIYSQAVADCFPKDSPAFDVAVMSIEAAKIFSEAVKQDMQKGQQDG